MQGENTQPSQREELLEQLELVNEAIRKVLSTGTSSYMIGRRQVTRVDISKLYDIRRQLRQELAALDTPGNLLYGVNVAVWDRR